MTIIRRRLRLWVAAWLVFQVASLSALVPRDCCAAHRPAASGKTPSCHEKHRGHATARLRAASGTPCPMHRGRSLRRRRPIQRTSARCAARAMAPWRRCSRCSRTTVCSAIRSSMLPDLHATGIAAPLTRESDRPPRVSRSSTSARVNAHRSGSKARVCLELCWCRFSRGGVL